MWHRDCSKKARYAFKDLPVLSKTQQLKVQSSRFQKSEERKRIDEQNQFLSSHIIEIQEGKNSQFRTIWTVSNFRQKPYVRVAFIVGGHFTVVWQHPGQEVTFSTPPQITAENWWRKLRDIKAARTHQANPPGEVAGANSPIRETTRSHD